MEIQEKEAKKEPKEATTEPIKQGDKLMLVAGCILGAVIIACVAAIYWRAHTPIDHERLGQIGDYYGGVLNPIIALATVGLVFITLHIQREELKATQKELDRTRTTTEDQNRAIKRQVFEQSFFSLHEHTRQRTQALKNSSLKRFHLTTFNEDHFYSYIHSQFAGRQLGELIGSDPDPEAVKGTIARELLRSWASFLEGSHSELETFYRLKWRLLNFIADQPIDVIPESEKQRFMGIVADDMDQLEYKLVFLKGFLTTDRSLVPLINKYGLLEGFPITSNRCMRFILDQCNHQARLIEAPGYQASAFADRVMSEGLLNF